MLQNDEQDIRSFLTVDLARFDRSVVCSTLQNKLNQFDATSLEGKQAKAHFIITLLDKADAYQKSKQPSFMTTREMIQSQIHPVITSTGEQLVSLSTVDHRSTPEAMNKSQLYTMFIDLNFLSDRGLVLVECRYPSIASYL